jgi:kumamolisin
VKLSLRAATALIAAPLPLLALAVVPAHAATAGSDPHGALSADVLPATVTGHAVRTGLVPSQQSIPLTLNLAVRDQAGLDAFLRQVTDPASPRYKHYLTVRQFAQRFGATGATVAKVTAYLTSQGLSVGPVSANHLTLQAHGTAAQVRRAFGTDLATYRDKATHRTWFANTTAPVLPGGIAAAVADIAGLNSYAVYHHDSVKRPQAVSHAVSGLTPSKARSGYNVASAISAGYTGSGQTVGLLEFSAFQQSNISAYDKYFSLSPSTPTVRSAGGGTTDLSGQDEVELDIEVVQALAPKAAVKVYEAPNSDAGELAVYSALVSDDVPIVSISWGVYEAGETSSNLSAISTDLQEAAAQGQSVFAASGDSGSDDAGNGGTSVDFPASDPYTTGTGGTSLSLSSTGAWSKETAWSGSGGGVSSYFPTPSYQTSVNSGGYRAVPDVAADADPSTGWAIYTQGAWYEFGGTSAAAPNWAAFTAIYDSEAKAKARSAFGYANSTIYALASSSKYGTAFHDVTSGSNGAYSAGTGYDEVTGWGSYNGAGFLSAELG